MKYKIADFKWDINEKYDMLQKEGKDYIALFDTADFSIAVNDSDLLYESSLSEFPCSNSYLEYISVFRKMGELLPLYESFILHCACFDVEGTGVAFLAKSTTGKTTHLSRWKSYLGDRLTVVNGDKPIVRFKNGLPIAYGTPWQGKEKLGSNTQVRLKHLCFIERGCANSAEKITKEQAIDKILNQIYIPKTNPQATSKTIELANLLLNTCKLWTVRCNLDADAGKAVYKTIFNK